MLNIRPTHYSTLHKIDIALSDELIAQYGLSIPVLVKIDQKGNKNELFWPFDENKITDFLFAEK